MNTSLRKRGRPWVNHQQAAVSFSWHLPTSSACLPSAFPVFLSSACTHPFSFTWTCRPFWVQKSVYFLSGRNSSEWIHILLFSLFLHFNCLNMILFLFLPFPLFRLSLSPVSFVRCQVLMVGGSLSPDGPIWSFIDDRRTEEGLPSCCRLAPSQFTHTNKHADLSRDTHTFIQSLESTQTPTQTLADTFLSFCLHFAMSRVPYPPFCTLTPSLLRPAPLSASSSLSFASCCGVTDSVTQEQTEGEAEGGRGGCESWESLCKTVQFANTITMNVKQLLEICILEEKRYCCSDWIFFFFNRVDV